MSSEESEQRELSINMHLNEPANESSQNLNIFQSIDTKKKKASRHFEYSP